MVKKCVKWLKLSELHIFRVNFSISGKNIDY